MPINNFIYNTTLNIHMYKSWTGGMWNVTKKLIFKFINCGLIGGVDDQIFFQIQEKMFRVYNLLTSVRTIVF